LDDGAVPGLLSPINGDWYPGGGYGAVTAFTLFPGAEIAIFQGPGLYPSIDLLLSISNPPSHDLATGAIGFFVVFLFFFFVINALLT
jgi:hypothetical protein